jgi:hypothetical protein
MLAEISGAAVDLSVTFAASEADTVELRGARRPAQLDEV